MNNETEINSMPLEIAKRQNRKRKRKKQAMFTKSITNYKK